MFECLSSTSSDQCGGETIDEWIREPRTLVDVGMDVKREQYEIYNCVWGADIPVKESLLRENDLFLGIALDICHAFATR